MASDKKTLAGQRLKRQVRGGTPVLLHTDNANQVIGLAEAFSNLKVIVTIGGKNVTGELLITDTGAVLKLDLSTVLGAQPDGSFAIPGYHNESVAATCTSGVTTYVTVLVKDT